MFYIDFFHVQDNLLYRWTDYLVSNEFLRPYSFYANTYYIYNSQNDTIDPMHVKNIPLELFLIDNLNIVDTNNV